MPSGPRKTQPDTARLDQVVAQARRDREKREQGYREQALKLFPWICGRCAREFAGRTLGQLTVHHKDGNHDNNPPDGSNWELLCLYCHDEEHARQMETARQGAGAGAAGTPSGGAEAPATHKPFAGLADLLKTRR